MVISGLMWRRMIFHYNGLISVPSSNVTKENTVVSIVIDPLLLYTGRDLAVVDHVLPPLPSGLLFTQDQYIAMHVRVGR